MAYSYGPTIVKNGLIFALDAANRKSYPGSGTVWSDLTGVGTTGSLVNGPTFDATNGGSIVFDGTNDYVDTINVSSLTDMSIDMWIYDARGLSGQRDILSYNGNFGAYTYSTDGGGRFRTDGNGLGARYFTITLPSQGQWYHFCYVKNANLYLNLTKYNGVGTDRTYGLISLGNTRSDINNRLNGRIANIKIYNRVLSDAEVLQNYTATKGRFGLA